MHEAVNADLVSILALYAQLGMDSGETLALVEAERLFERI